jgi:hypothetical protein
MTVVQQPFLQNGDLAPQAIFWRPVRYFTNRILYGQDDLDEFEGASFSIGNHISFDLRTYKGHPDCTVSLYMPMEFREPTEISRITDEIVKAIQIPLTAVAWRRGQDFKYGELMRPVQDRLREPEARILALKIAAASSDGVVTTKNLKNLVPNYFELSAKDRERSQTRSHEQIWQQIVGNVISHQDTPQGPFKRGFAKRTKTGLAITERGRAYLNNMGFSDFPEEEKRAL